MSQQALGGGKESRALKEGNAVEWEGRENESGVKITKPLGSLMGKEREKNLQTVFCH